MKGVGGGKGKEVGRSKPKRMLSCAGMLRNLLFWSDITTYTQFSSFFYYYYRNKMDKNVNENTPNGDF